MSLILNNYISYALHLKKILQAPFAKQFVLAGTTIFEGGLGNRGTNPFMFQYIASNPPRLTMNI